MGQVQGNYLQPKLARAPVSVHGASPNRSSPLYVPAHRRTRRRGIGAAATEQSNDQARVEWSKVEVELPNRKGEAGGCATEQPLVYQLVSHLSER